MNQVVSMSGQISALSIDPKPFKVYTHNQMDKIPQVAELPEEMRFEMKVVASVLPFRVNQYVIDELIDWQDPLNCPIFRLMFPQKEMLEAEDFDKVAELVRAGASMKELKVVVNEVREKLNPHPAGQKEMNVPQVNGEAIEGLQHKYRETVLFFPSQGQVCHSYCTFCFRWAQFVGDADLRFAAKEASQFHDYLREHTEVTDVLFTGGDPMVMKTKNLRAYLEAFMTDESLSHVQTIRIGSKALTFWPYRFVTDPDAEDLLELLRELSLAGKHVAFMAHYNHPKEMQTPVAKAAISAIRSTGAQIRSQGPLLNHINRDAQGWADMWREQVQLGIIPYYMFVERDTGAQHYFEVPLVEAWNIFRDAYQQVSGVARTVRGPSMSADPGKVEIQGVCEINGEKVISLRFIQGRNPDWVNRPFFAKYDEKATWLHHLEPAFGEEKWFWTDEFEAMKAGKM
ncbi:KamA family radical SAM protein [Salinibius halmophilus]|uniref:KamA family radical SAM protein n=1 Tax=Salinibius halmophilus TaxID=1853216 RepID=UPI000E674952|nr:lysine 2,3-aminomutase [Salinibius halmophilus]